jgi:hypothetical protein
MSPSMPIDAYVENGQIVLSDPLSLPDGTKVSISLQEVPSRLLLDRMKSVIGIAGDMPPDASRNIDHYLYGHPKQ